MNKNRPEILSLLPLYSHTTPIADRYSTLENYTKHSKVN
jgi:hypothetical protein